MSNDVTPQTNQVFDIPVYDPKLPPPPAPVEKPPRRRRTVAELATPEQLREMLMQSILLLSSFRNRLEKAGYPFAEPPGVRDLINKADTMLFPDSH